MRYLSWAVVLISVGFIGAWLARDGVFDGAGFGVDEREAIGTMVQQSGHDEASSPVILASGYTQAWNSHDPDRVAAFFTPGVVFVVNDGEPFHGHAGIRRLVGEFLAEVPDLALVMDFIEPEGDHLVYHWTFTGTHVDGRRVQVSGTETWWLDGSGLIAESRGHYDADDYAAQIAAHTTR